MGGNKPVPLREIADRIDAHLRRFERDPSINKTPTFTSYKDGKQHQGVKPYYCAGAHVPARSARVHVRYVSFQGVSLLPRAEAEQYLAWLDAGNVGTHYTAGIDRGRVGYRS